MTWPPNSANLPTNATDTTAETSGTASDHATLHNVVSQALIDASTALALLVENVNTVASSGSSFTVPAVTTATISKVTLTSASVTPTFPAAAAGKSFALELDQDATGGRVVLWPASVKWANGTPPTLSTAANARDLTSFICTDGSTWLGNLAGLSYQ